MYMHISKQPPSKQINHTLVGNPPTLTYILNRTPDTLNAEDCIGDTHAA